MTNPNGYAPNGSVAPQVPGPQTAEPQASSSQTTPTRKGHKNGKPKKPFWKKWWFWLIVVLVIFGLANMGGGNGSSEQRSSSTSQGTTGNTSASTPTPSKKSVLTSIEAAYNGTADNGEQITDKSPITVTAKYDDGSSKTVNGWKVQNPGPINYNKPTAFTIQYEGKTAKLSIQANPPVEYRNALNKAKSYSDMMHMSKQGIYDQLTSEYGEKFPAAAAQYAVDHLKADYNANALSKAKDYQKTMSMSSSAIYDQLVSEYGEKFTPAEAQYAIDHLNQ